MVKKIIFYGDSELTPMEPIWFINTKYGYVICDLSECGYYIAEKMAQVKGNKMSLTTLNRVIWLLMGLHDISNIEVEAENNGILRFFEGHNIKTIEDLRQYFIKKLGCTYP
jgi:hypothetical protein